MGVGKILVIKCCDNRIQKPVRLFLEKRGYSEHEFIPQDPPGGAINFMKIKEFLDFIVYHLRPKEIWVFNHQDCAAYKKIRGENTDDKVDHHRGYLLRAKELLSSFYPRVKVRLFFVRKVGDRWYVLQVRA